MGSQFRQCLGAQNLSTFATTSLNYGSSAGCTHPTSESVLIFAFSIGRLKSAFHLPYSRGKISIAFRGRIIYDLVVTVSRFLVARHLIPAQTCAIHIVVDLSLC